MKIYVNIKQAGVRKNYIAKKEIYLKSIPLTLRDLIGEIISMNVKDFNEKKDNHKILSFLTDEDITNKLKVGKVSFGDVYNTAKADLEKALECAFLAFEDGIFRVFIGDEEAVDLDDAIGINEEDVLTFIRLTMLSGRMW